MKQRETISKYWRSLDELEHSPEFQAFVEREFPVAASEFPTGVSRRRWLQLMAASFTLAGVSGCRWQTEKIAPFAERPESRIPGRPESYATSIEWAGRVRHLLVTCYDGRPIKVEGNPDHPDARGATDAVSQACILDLYDPDRSAKLTQVEGRHSFNRTWSDFQRWIRQHLNNFASNGGDGFAVLIEPTTSPSVHSLLEQMRAKLPQMRLYEDDSSRLVAQQSGAELAFDQRLATDYELSEARVIVCLDADLLHGTDNSLRYAREFAERRDPDGEWMNRLYAIESGMSVTGAAADHRLGIRSSDIAEFLSVLEQRLRDRLEGGRAGGRGEANLPSGFLERLPDHARLRAGQFVEAICDDLCAHRRASVITAGPCQPAEVHARVHAINALLDNVGVTVHYTADPWLIDHADGLAALKRDIDRGAINTLAILGANPVFTAAAEWNVADAIADVPHTISLSRHEDETARLCSWRLPLSHPFESWGDVRAHAGTIGVTQPLIAPLLDGKSVIEVLAMLVDDARDPRQIVRDSIGGLSESPMSEARWRQLVHDGLLPGSEFPRITPQLASDRTSSLPAVAVAAGDDLELVFTHSNAVFDGRLANNGWLQETPDPVTKLTWDNAAIFSSRTAARLGVEHGTLVDLHAGDRSLRVPAFILPGQAENSISLALGYGRRAAGRVGGSETLQVPPVGTDASLLRSDSSTFVIQGVEAKPTGIAYELATTQDHHAIDTLGREEIGQRVGELVRETTLEDYQEHPDFAQHRVHHPPLESLWQEPSYEGYAWGMSIDLNKCIGCNACMVACQSENNVPIVGKDQVLKGREMHWIRVDRYFSGEPEAPDVAHQPLACHHCENAPCEQVCPVAATVHSDEGLNDMIYNRCVGTRYCANNCPYKVRRFNFFDYNQQLEAPGGELVQLGVNPEVTVRSRGVMEKCTYCVQRIQHAKIEAKNDGRPVRDGEVVTACQQACPTRAIEFGDLNDKKSRVAKSHADPRAYGMLAELNVKPRTKYLARIRNPHPLLAKETASPDRGHPHRESHTS